MRLVEIPEARARAGFSRAARTRSPRAVRVSAIQHAVSPIDFDFWAWGMEKYDRAVAEFTSAEFAALLRAARAPEKEA